MRFTFSFFRYMSVHEVYSRPSKEDLLSYFAEKFERQGLFPSGEECVHAVQEKLDKEAITLPVHNLQMYINKVGTNDVPGLSLKNTLTKIDFITQGCPKSSQFYMGHP